MTGFKSFGNRTITAIFAPGFTSVIGPKGSGKSNLVEGFRFCFNPFGDGSVLTQNVQNILFESRKNDSIEVGRIGLPSNQAEVTVFFDNTAREFPFDGDEFFITRTLNRHGLGTCKINGREVPESDVISAINGTNINLNGPNFLFQGEIEKLSLMENITRRKYIEGLAALRGLDEIKERTLKQLEEETIKLGKLETSFTDAALHCQEAEENVKQGTPDASYDYEQAKTMLNSLDLQRQMYQRQRNATL